MTLGVVIAIVVGIMILVTLVKTARTVPHQTVYIVERLGKYSRTLSSGFHILIPFIDRVAYRHTLKEQALDVPPQRCITCDNIAVEVDGILYLQVTDPVKASYGIMDYTFATVQLAQTTMRSLIGKLDLDRTFEERDATNNAIVRVLDEASDPWGVKVTRYEVKNIEPPQTIRDAMEKQMRAEREKRALIAESEGDRAAKINRAEGEKMQNIQISEGEKTRQINVAEGRAKEILLLAEATAEGIRRVAQAIREEGGSEAVSLRIAEQYVSAFSNVAKQGTTLILPANLADVGSAVAGLTTCFRAMTPSAEPPASPAPSR